MGVDVRRLVGLPRLSEAEQEYGHLRGLERRFFAHDSLPRAFLDIDYRLLAPYDVIEFPRISQQLSDLKVRCDGQIVTHRQAGSRLARAYSTLTSPTRLGDPSDPDGSVMDLRPVVVVSGISARSSDDRVKHLSERGGRIMFFKTPEFSAWHLSASPEVTESLHRFLSRRHIEKEVVTAMAHWAAGRPADLDLATFKRRLKTLTGALTQRHPFGLVNTSQFSEVDPIDLEMSIAEYDYLREVLEHLTQDIKVQFDHILQHGKLHITMGDSFFGDQINAENIHALATRSSGVNQYVNVEVGDLIREARAVEGVDVEAIDALESELQEDAPDHGRLRELGLRVKNSAPSALAAVNLALKIFELAVG